MKPERLQKILAQSGIASRRAAEKLIEDGRVRVNGRVVKELGAKADPHKDRIDVDDKRIVAEKKFYVVLHKPRGVVSTMSDPEGRPTVKDYLDRIGARVVPVGRLDFATSGVLLATNDGDFAYALLHPKQKVPKTYVLKASGEMKEADLERWRTGIELDDGITQPAGVTFIRHENGKTWLELTITEGRNQMIRRMGEKTGFPVMRLARTSFAEISSEGLPPGKWRFLTRDELVAMKKKYGVPKSIPTMLEPAAMPTRRFDRTPTQDSRGRKSNDRPREDRPRGDRPHGTARPRDNDRPRTSGRPARDNDRPRTSGRPARENDRARTSGRPPRDNDRPRTSGQPPRDNDRPRTSGRPPRENERPRTSGRPPRSSGGSPASRSAQWKPDEPAREPYGLGRSGRSRTTGTGGGVGGEGGGDYRLRRTRRG